MGLLSHLRGRAPLIFATFQMGLVVHYALEHHYMLAFPFGVSMVPTFGAVGDVLVISMRHRRGRDVAVGDIVTFADPRQDRYRVIKRVVGMPGDFVLAHSPDVAWERGGGEMLQVPEGHCFVAGDNQQFSRDSREYGPFPLALIKGKVIARLWPWSKRGWFEGGLAELDKSEG